MEIIVTARQQAIMAKAGEIMGVGVEEAVQVAFSEEVDRIEAILRTNLGFELEWVK